jgi:hypothetical protein
MRCWVLKSCVVSASMVSVGVPMPAQSVVIGTVREDSTGRPLAAVGITVEGAKQQALTDSLGRYVIEAPNGRRVLGFRLPGYQPLRLGVFARGDTVHADATLIRTLATPLQAVQVNAPGHAASLGRDGFADRRAMGIGKFIDSTALRLREDRRLTDVLRELAGVRLQEYREPGSSIVELRVISPFKPMTPAVRQRDIVMEGLPPCWSSVFLNGTPIYRSDRMDAGRPPDMGRDFSVASLESVEFYRTGSEVPQQFGGSNANCGALVLWTRR